MVRFTFVMLALCGLSTVLPAQVSQIRGKDTKGTDGLAIGITDAAQIDRFLLFIPGVGSGRQALEQQSLKPYMMPVRRVGARGSDWSYALASCLEYYVNLNRNYKDNLSPDYIALSLQASGARPSLDQGLRFLATTGTVSAAIIPYDAIAIPTAVYATTPYRITNFLHIFRDITKGREKVFEVRKALMRGNPVVVEMFTDAGFAGLRDVYQWQPAGVADQARTLIVVGYDETQQTFELQSAYGSEWANNGYIWVRYADFERLALNGYAMVPTGF